MDKVLMRAGAVMVLLVGGLIGSGCGGSGQTVHLDVVPKPMPAQMAEPEAVKIVVVPFEDRRMEKSRVGMRTHLWGGVTYFNTKGDKPGDAYAQALAERLRARGWHDRSWDVRVLPAGSENSADIVITGQIVDLSANAKSRMFSTALTSSSKVTISAHNNADKTTTNRTIEGAQTDTVFWFTDSDIQKVLTATIKDTIDRYVEDTTISQRTLRPSR
ncbi:conserved protein of unknown function [Nitrospira japonica]|uniref:Lipoprotein n=1 Tax=Nitrospira japonica TaxID=1325564 RepID=A0A1W1I4Q8_9BACT|nr:hypothetical protein [Nitrospira japonica]SLM47869.1 conserved protein of unknown function [Nitrospira japonica]